MATTGSNLSTEQITTWKNGLTSNLTKLRNQIDSTENIIQTMSGIVKSDNDKALHQALVDLKALLDQAEAKLLGFQNNLNSSLSTYIKSIGSAQDALSDAIKKQDQFRENANKISKL